MLPSNAGGYGPAAGKGTDSHVSEVFFRSYYE